MQTQINQTSKKIRINFFYSKIDLTQHKFKVIETSNRIPGSKKRQLDRHANIAIQEKREKQISQC